MATTIAHGLVGITVFCVVNVALPERRRLPVGPTAFLGAAAVANIPDLDIVFGLLMFGNHKALHGEITHSLAFALVCGVLVGLFWRRSELHKELGFMVLLLLASHTVVDSLTGRQLGFHASSGPYLLWPFIDGHIHLPITVFQGVQHDNLVPDAYFTAAWELIILSPLALVAIWLARRYSNTRAQSLGLALGRKTDEEDIRP